jgi:hypothetical protein
MKGVRPWLVRWARRADTIDFPLLWLHWLAQYKYFFPHRTLFQLCPIVQQPGQAAVQGLSVCLWMCVSGCDAGQIVIYLQKKKRKKRGLKDC